MCYGSKNMVCASLNNREKMKAEPSWLIP